MIKTLQTAFKRYNDLMEMVGHEYMTIGTSFSEDTEEFTLGDMVDEVDYVVSCYYEEGHIFNNDKYEDYNQWLSEVNKLKRFINRYGSLRWDYKEPILKYIQ